LYVPGSDIPFNCRAADSKIRLTADHNQSFINSKIRISIQAGTLVWDKKHIKKSCLLRILPLGRCQVSFVRMRLTEKMSTLIQVSLYSAIPECTASDDFYNEKIKSFFFLISGMVASVYPVFYFLKQASHVPKFEDPTVQLSPKKMVKNGKSKFRFLKFSHSYQINQLVMRRFNIKNFKHYLQSGLSCTQ